MTDPIAKGVKLEDAIVILREGLRSDRPLTLKERLLIGKIIDERAALTAAGEMARELAEAREALKPFSEEAFRYEPPEDDDDNRLWDCRITIGDLRRAARALETTKPRI